MSARFHRAVIASTGVLLSSLAAKAQVAQVPAEGISGASLDALMAQFRSDEPLAFSGIVSLVIPGDPVPCEPCVYLSYGGASIPGLIEFRNQDAKYYYSVQMDASLAPGLSAEVAYDGAEFQLLLDTGTLMLGPQDSDGLLPLLPHPLAELGSFLRPLTDANADRRLRYKDVQDLARQARVIDAQWQSCQLNGQFAWCTNLPGGVYEDRVYGYRIYVLAANNGFPARIERVGSDGSVYTRSDFLDYVAVPGAQRTFYWPQRVVMEAYDDTGALAGRIEYELATFQMGAQAAAAGFRIDCQHAVRIWDESLQQFAPASSGTNP